MCIFPLHTKSIPHSSPSLLRCLQSPASCNKPSAPRQSPVFSKLLRQPRSISNGKTIGKWWFNGDLWGNYGKTNREMVV